MKPIDIGGGKVVVEKTWLEGANDIGLYKWEDWLKEWFGGNMQSSLKSVALSIIFPECTMWGKLVKMY